MGEYDPLTNYAVYVYTVYMANNFGSKCYHCVPVRPSHIHGFIAPIRLEQNQYGGRTMLFSKEYILIQLLSLELEQI